MSGMPIPTNRQAPAALRIVTLVTLFLTIIPGAAYSDPANPHVISIAEARSLPLGTVVTIDGSVTVPSGAFNSSTGDQGFAIQDHTGGIYVSVPDNLGFGLRQQVRVTGELADTVVPGLLVLINVTDIKTHGSGPNVHALPVATGAVGEGTEGKLVRISGTITQPIFNDPPYGFIIFINDGSGEVHSFVSASTGIDVSGLSQGQTIQVTGFSSEFAGSFEVDPRIQDDIEILP
jgi:DNA/RNA endonuclease YhcR with UshA esterase domain